MTLVEFINHWLQIRDSYPAGSLVPPQALVDKILDDARKIQHEKQPLQLWYTTNQAAPLLGVCAKTVTNWCKQGRFPNAKKTSPGKGGKWTIPACDIEAFNQQEAA